MAQSAALNFILVRDAQCARHHIARSDQNDTECVPCAKNRSRSCQIRKVYTCERFPTSSRQGRQSNHWQGKRNLNFKTQVVLTGRVLLDWCSSLVRPEPLRWECYMQIVQCQIGISRSHSSSCQLWALWCWALTATVDVACVTSHGMYTRCIQVYHVLYWCFLWLENAPHGGDIYLSILSCPSSTACTSWCIWCKQMKYSEMQVPHRFATSEITITENHSSYVLVLLIALILHHLMSYKTGLFNILYMQSGLSVFSRYQRASDGCEVSRGAAFNVSTPFTISRKTTSWHWRGKSWKRCTTKEVSWMHF